MIIQWMSVLGATGFLCGFIGPMLLAPEANQGPMLGLFITGPGGAILGLALGFCVSNMEWPTERSKRALYACATLLSIVTLYFCIPSPRYRADVVQGSIDACHPVDSLREKTIAELNMKKSGRSDAKPVDWREKFDLANANKPGVVIVLHATRVTRIFEKQARWNRGDLLAKAWSDMGQEASYFASYSGADCAYYPAGTQVVLTATGMTGIWPPYGIAEMLDVKTAEPLPVKYEKLLGNTLHIR